MLKATKQETQDIQDYMLSQAPREKVEFVQKLHSESLNSVRHDIWDVHTKRARWWVITNPTNLYSQKQFPNMDLALTFHVGLCLRIPKHGRPSMAEQSLEPLVACWRAFDEITEELSRADETEAFQAIGVRCREALLSFCHVAQELIPQPDPTAIPKKSDFNEWSELVANATLPGSSHEERRGLLKSAAKSAWKYVNWVAHARDTIINDAEAAVSSTEFTLSLFTTALIRFHRGVPDRCPSCRSLRLSPERGVNTSEPKTTYERPVCEKCGWTGEPVIIAPAKPRRKPPIPKSECVLMTKPLRKFPMRKHNS